MCSYFDNLNEEEKTRLLKLVTEELNEILKIFVNEFKNNSK